ncbi:MAG: DUF4870 domain-containing protein [Phycisphaerae bacterium]|nr:DUF4870 domain-containing protein [Phycisphaerae bacterium]MBT6165799.1 DUF4870 domain-containing protein [Phycisphaerae bacterium]
MLASLLLRTGHLIGSVVPFASLIIPLVLINTVGKEDDFVKQNAKEALNLLLFAVIVGIISIPLCFVIIGFFILIALSLFVFIFSIIAAIQTMSAKQGDAPYKYPIIFRLIS